MNNKERRELRALHDSYDKHDIRPVTTIKAEKAGPGYRIKGIYGQCSCGKAFSYDNQKAAWMPLLRSDEAIHIQVFPDDMSELVRLYKEGGI